MTSIPYGKQYITKDDLAAVAKALQSDYLTQGPTTKLFEDTFASYILHLSAMALGVDD